MKTAFFILFISLFLWTSCADEPKVADVPETSTERPEQKNKSPKKGKKKTYKVPLPPGVGQEKTNKKTAAGPRGAYVGMFEAEVYDEEKDYTSHNKINISLDELKNGRVKGHSVVAGNKRPFSGTYTMDKAGDYIIKAKEPGDDKYDGTFEFVCVPKDKVVQGRWIANNKKLAVAARSFNLKRKDFEYNPALQLKDRPYGELVSSQQDFDADGEFLTSDAYKFNASTDILNKEDIENMYKGDLEIMRNTIYARHGYSFKNRKMRFFFDSYVDWYMPVSTDIRSELTELELANIDLLKRYEQHAGRYYDSFGR